MNCAGLDERFYVTYRIFGSAEFARRTAERLCADQTIEAPVELLEAYEGPRSILGALEEFYTEDSTHHSAIVSFPIELFGSSCPQLLHTLFGTASLTAGIQVADLRPPAALPRGWPGPRYGQTGLRVMVDVPSRPLVCAVLKPLGLPPERLAEMAFQLAMGGVDLVKDDQGLGDHQFCRFEERVRRCVDAVQTASQETSRACLYFPHVSGTPQETMERIRFAQAVGADGVHLCPGLIGYGTVHEIARDPSLAMPIISHPAFVGTYAIERRSGLAPHVLYGQLPRLIGADVSLFPVYGLDFPVSREDCRQIADACSANWAGLAPTFPTAAGRMGISRIDEMSETFGKHFVFVLGSQIYHDRLGITAACNTFMAALRKTAG